MEYMKDTKRFWEERNKAKAALLEWLDNLSLAETLLIKARMREDAEAMKRAAIIK